MFIIGYNHHLQSVQFPCSPWYKFLVLNCGCTCSAAPAAWAPAEISISPAGPENSIKNFDQLIIMSMFFIEALFIDGARQAKLASVFFLFRWLQISRLHWEIYLEILSSQFLPPPFAIGLTNGILSQSASPVPIEYSACRACGVERQT